jgi:hypothetical protein
LAEIAHMPNVRQLTGSRYGVDLHQRMHQRQWPLNDLTKCPRTKESLLQESIALRKQPRAKGIVPAGRPVAPGKSRQGSGESLQSPVESRCESPRSSNESPVRCRDWPAGKGGSPGPRRDSPVCR